MKRGGAVGWGLALAAGGAAGLLAWGAVRHAQRAAEHGWEPVPVVVAQRDLPEGTVLTLDDLARRAVPRKLLTPSYVLPDDVPVVEGARLRVALRAGDPLGWALVGPEPAALPMARRIQPRGRAFAVPAGRLQSAGGAVLPGDHVDVLATFPEPHGGGRVATTLLQDVIVLAVGDRRDEAAPESAPAFHDTVTLLVLPEEAELLALATEVGRIALSLRHPEDLDPVPGGSRTTVATLLTGERRTALEKVRRRTIQVIRGRRDELERLEETP